MEDSEALCFRSMGLVGMARQCKELEAGVDFSERFVPGNYPGITRHSKRFVPGKYPEKYSE